MNLTHIAAFFVGVMCMCAFTLDLMSDPKESRWQSLPPLARWWFRVTAAVLLVRCFDMVDIGLNAPGVIVIGQINYLALLSSFFLSGSAVILTGLALANQLPGKSWDRLVWVLKAMKADPTARPVIMPEAAILDAHHAAGQPAVCGAQPHEVVRESERAGQMAKLADLH
jgi:hypothetical protein